MDCFRKTVFSVSKGDWWANWCWRLYPLLYANLHLSSFDHMNFPLGWATWKFFRWRGWIWLQRGWTRQLILVQRTRRAGWAVTFEGTKFVSGYLQLALGLVRSIDMWHLWWGRLRCISTLCWFLWCWWNPLGDLSCDIVDDLKRSKVRKKKKFPLVKFVINHIWNNYILYNWFDHYQVFMRFHRTLLQGHTLWSNMIGELITILLIGGLNY